MKKNETITVTIEDMGVNGEGIGKTEGYTLFVKDAVIGDTVEAVVTKVKKGYGYAKMQKIVAPSPFRVPARCPVARACGGCQLQELSYAEQLRFKQRKVRGNLERIGGFAPDILDGALETICGMEEPFCYRNKAQFPVGTDRAGQIVTGFFAGRTHQIIPSADCAIGEEQNAPILRIITEFMEEYRIPAYDETTRQGLVRHVLLRCGFATKERMVCLVINGNRLPHAKELVERLLGIPGMTSILYSINREDTNVILGKEIRLLWGKPYITDQIRDLRYRISPLSFYQVNPAQTERLYELALEYAGLTGRETVWDLYCGIGTISLFLAGKAGKVYGVECVPQAVEDARANARLNGIENAEFFAGKAEDVLPDYYARYEREHGMKAHADVIVVDPPRKGCEESLLDTVARMEPDRIVYVSCDSATLARDLKYLCGRGYGLSRVRPVDMFPMTVGVECACLLTRLHADHHIEVELQMDEPDLTAAESKATYEEIKDYVLEHTGLKVSNLYIAQIKQKCGIIERVNYNLPKSEGARGPVDLCYAPIGAEAKTARQPKCPEEKERAIREALEYFKLV